ncbi:hypothetical protein GL218_01142 [Daldinia childiae]|uniref:uncharacterized protein n=1 Tax=Daldinia childiae TaxID=326645 RepID=UPI0014480896|nr:uncharacterized protein GL218_01142 [Daldinia childiae]KAF3063588.1 hypothetical protein GL218_01142 [Daldinia childiae]
MGLRSEFSSKINEITAEITAVKDELISQVNDLKGQLQNATKKQRPGDVGGSGVTEERVKALIIDSLQQFMASKELCDTIAKYNVAFLASEKGKEVLRDAIKKSPQPKTQLKPQAKAPETPQSRNIGWTGFTPAQQSVQDSTPSIFGPTKRKRGEKSPQNQPEKDKRRKKTTFIDTVDGLFEEINDQEHSVLIADPEFGMSAPVKNLRLLVLHGSSEAIMFDSLHLRGQHQQFLRLQQGKVYLKGQCEGIFRPDNNVLERGCMVVNASLGYRIYELARESEESEDKISPADETSDIWLKPEEVMVVERHLMWAWLHRVVCFRSSPEMAFDVSSRRDVILGEELLDVSATRKRDQAKQAGGFFAIYNNLELKIVQGVKWLKPTGLAFIPRTHYREVDEKTRLKWPSLALVTYPLTA